MQWLAWEEEHWCTTQLRNSTLWILLLQLESRVELQKKPGAAQFGNHCSRAASKVKGTSQRWLLFLCVHSVTCTVEQEERWKPKPGGHTPHCFHLYKTCHTSADVGSPQEYLDNALPFFSTKPNRLHACVIVHKCILSPPHQMRSRHAG